MTNHIMTPEEACERAPKLVWDFIPSMLPKHRYPLETLCGNEFWDRLSKGLRTEVGHHIANMVTNNILPLEFGDTGHKSTKMYQRSSGVLNVSILANKHSKSIKLKKGSIEDEQ